MDDARTPKGRATRARIVEATARQILEAGIGGTTLDSVRAATVTSKSQLFHYFPGGKAELVREVAAWEADQLAAAQQPHIDDLSTPASWLAWRDALARYYFGLGRWSCPIGSIAAEASHSDPELSRAIAAVLTEWRSKLAAGVARLEASGSSIGVLTPDRTAAALIAALQGGLLLAQSERAAWPLEAALDHAFSALGIASAATSERDAGDTPRP